MKQDLESPVFISADIARAVFRWPDAVGALQHAYAQPFDPLSAPARTIAQSGGAWLRSLSAAPTGGRYYGAKLMGMAMASARPAVEYVVVLFDRETSRICAFVDGNLVTGFRTAATSAAALDRLAPAGPAQLGIVGAGLEAAMHARAFASVRPLTQVSVYSPTPASRENFAQALERDIGVPVVAVGSPQEAVGNADIVLAAARSKGEVPILYGDWLGENATVVSVGSTVPQQREIDSSVVARADLIVCDMLDEVMEETGDMIAAHAAGIDAHDRAYSLHDLMAGRIASQVAAARRPMFKSVGGGLQDIVVAGMILDKALEAGLAKPLPMAFETKF